MQRSIWTAVLALAAAGSVLLSQSGSDPDPKKLKSPVPYTKTSIARGAAIFMQNCAGCHGEDGKAAGPFAASATNLAAPNLYKRGIAEGEIFHSIHEGAGTQMPPFKYQGWADQDLWHLVNFIHSLWPSAMRPPLQTDKK